MSTLRSAIDCYRRSPRWRCGFGVQRSNPETPTEGQLKIFPRPPIDCRTKHQHMRTQMRTETTQNTQKPEKPQTTQKDRKNANRQFRPAQTRAHAHTTGGSTNAHYNNTRTSPGFSAKEHRPPILAILLVLPERRFWVCAA